MLHNWINSPTYCTDCQEKTIATEGDPEVFRHKRNQKESNDPAKYNPKHKDKYCYEYSALFKCF